LVHTAFSISAEVSTVLLHFELNPQTALLYEKQNRKSHSWRPDWVLELNAKRSMMLWFIYNWVDILDLQALQDAVFFFVGFFCH